MDITFECFTTELFSLSVGLISKNKLIFLNKIIYIAFCQWKSFDKSLIVLFLQRAGKI